MSHAIPVQWHRTKRVTVYDSSGPARYASVAKAADGSILVLFSTKPRSLAVARSAP